MMNKKQHIFSDRAMIVMLAMLSAFPPLSTDVYLPALPHVMMEFNASQSAVNLSLSLFLAFFALGILIWGPVSEKYGRKPILLTGLVLYVMGSAGCALSTNVTMLLISRVFQAFGGGAAEAVATAMVKDLYSGRKRETVLAAVMSMVVIAPVVAPVAGAQILKIMSWHTIFWVLTGIGSVALVLSMRLDETLKTPYQGSIPHALGRLFVVLKNPGFTILLVLFSMVALPIMSFIGASAFIYMQEFGMDEQTYSFVFGLNALGSMVGPLLYLRFSRRISPYHIITGGFFCITVTGIFILLKGSLSALMFVPGMLAATVACSLMRPPSANMLLCQQEKDTGSAASLINFTALFLGSLGMFFISLQPTEKLIPSLGIIQIIVGFGCGSLWIVLKKCSFIRRPD